MRALFLSVAALAPVAGPVAAADPPLVTKVFCVADLVTPIPNLEPSPAALAPPAGKTAAENAEQVVKLVTGMVRPYSWSGHGGRGTAEYFDTGFALVVTNTPDAVKEVADLLEALRRLQDVSVATEVRILKLPAGFCERAGLKWDSDTTLTERELAVLLEAVQGHAEANVMQCPKVTTFDGQSATVRCGERRDFVTRLEVAMVKGEPVFVPKQTTVDLGDTLTLRGRVSADGKSVALRAKLTRTRLVGEVKLMPVTTFVTPVFEGGSQGQPIPFTQHIQAPELKTEKAEREAVIPHGGTVVLGGWKEAAEKPRPAAGRIPYLPRPVKIAPAEFEVVVLATARVVRTPEAPVAPMPREAGDKASAYKLRHVAAADAVAAVGKYLEAHGLHATLTVEPVSNSVLVCAEHGVRLEVLKVLATLDREPVQVLVQAMVLKVPRGFCEQAGLEGAGNSWTLSPREAAMFNALIRAGKAKNAIDIYARPQLQVNDGQTGFVQVGQDVPVVTPAVLPAGGAAPAAKVAFVPVGVTLRVTPKVAPDGAVRLDAQVSLGEVSAAGVKTQSVRFDAIVPSGQTLVFACRGAGSLTGVVRKACDRDDGETLIVLTPHRVRK